MDNKPTAIKGVTWEVTLRSAPELYYKGRGDTPELAMGDLIGCLTVGLKDAAERSGAIARRHSLLEEALAELAPREEIDGQTAEAAGPGDEDREQSG